MRDNSSVYVLMITDNDGRLLESTIESVRKQTYPLERIHVMIIDNVSNDGTYEQLLQYETKYPQLISVMRAKKKTTRGRLLKEMTHHLSFTTVDASVLLYPGDILYPEFFSVGMECMRCNEYLSIVVYEADLNTGLNITSQKKIYSNSCILNSMCSSAYYKDGIGHLSLCLFRELPINENTKLPYYSVIAEHREWFVLSYYKLCNCMYRAETGGVIYTNRETDTVSQLFKKAFYYKRNCYAIETNVFSTLYANDPEILQVQAGYRCLSIMGLQMAVQELKKGNHKTAEDCLLFAEMMDLSIIAEERYELVKNAVENNQTGSLEAIRQQLESATVYPPSGSLVF